MGIIEQRVRKAEVILDDVPIGRIGRGRVLLVGPAVGDGGTDTPQILT